MVRWTEQFTTGSVVLDRQHQILIDNINQLEEMLSLPHPTRLDYESMIAVVDFIEYYANTHFQVEEECMAAYRCPAHAENQQAHTEFLKFFREFKEHNRTKGFPRKIVAELHVVMTKWIEEHILRVDTQLKSCMKG